MTLAWSCTRESEFHDVSVKDLYSIAIPTYLDSSAEFNPGASLQYVNVDKAVYIMVIDQPKSELNSPEMQVTLDAYYNLVASRFAVGDDPTTATPPSTRELNGLKSMQTEATGIENTHEIYYKLAVVESESHFYQILAWTLLDQKAKYSDDLQRMIDSFEEDQTV